MRHEDSDRDDGHAYCEMQDCGRIVCLDHRAGECSCIPDSYYTQGMLVDGLPFCTKPCAMIAIEEKAEAAEATPAPVVDGDETEKIPHETAAEVINEDRGGFRRIETP